MDGQKVTIFIKNEAYYEMQPIMEVTSEEALLRFWEKRISAVHGDPSDYAVLEMSELFGKTVEYPQTNFHRHTFAGVSYNHSVTTDLWELRNETDLF